MPSSVEVQIPCADPSGYYSEPEIYDLQEAVNAEDVPYNFMSNIHRCFGEHVEPAKLRQCDDNVDAPFSSKSRNECSGSLVIDGISNSSSLALAQWSVEFKILKELGDSDVLVGGDEECDLATCPCRNPELVMEMPST